MPWKYQETDSNVATLGYSFPTRKSILLVYIYHYSTQIVILRKSFFNTWQRTLKQMFRFCRCNFKMNIHERYTNRNHSVVMCHWRIQGALGTRAPLSVQFLPFPCSFQQKSCQKIGFCPELKGWRHPPPSWIRHWLLHCF